MADESCAGGKTDARKPKPTLSREEHRALLTHHMSKLRAASAAVEEARGPFDEAKAELTALVNEAKADLGKTYTRKYLLGLLEDAQSRLRDLLREEEQRFRDRQDLGLPVFGAQQAFDFGGDETPREVRDELEVEAEGYLVGRRAGPREAPDGCPARFVQAFLKGYDRGQDENGRLFIEANALIAKRGEPDALDEPAELNEPEAGTPEAKKAERQSVARAKESLSRIGVEPAQAAA